MVSSCFGPLSIHIFANPKRTVWEQRVRPFLTRNYMYGMISGASINHSTKDLLEEVAEPDESGQQDTEEGWVFFFCFFFVVRCDT